jgi:hypothetical protein
MIYGKATVEALRMSVERLDVPSGRNHFATIPKSDIISEGKTGENETEKKKTE